MSQSDQGRDPVASMSRRELMRGAAVAGGAAATGGAALHLDAGSTGRADALAPLAVAGGLVAAGYLVHEVQDQLTGADATDKDDYQQAQKQEALAEIEARAASMVAANDTVFTTMENRLSDSENIAWGRAKSAYISGRAASKGHSASKSDAVDAVQGYYSTVQTNVINYNTEMAVKMYDLTQTADAAGYAEVINVWDTSYPPFYARRPDGSNPRSLAGWNLDAVAYSPTSQTVTLLDGTSITAKHVEITDRNGTAMFDTSINETNGADGNSGTPNVLTVETATGATYQPIYNANRAQGLYDQILSLNSTMESDVQTWADDIDSAKSRSDIIALPTDDPSSIASNYSADEHWSYAGADLAALGISTDWESSSLIYLNQNDVTVTGQIFLTQDGKTLDVGPVYDPANITGAVYLAYNTPEDSTPTGTGTPTSTPTATPSSTPTSTPTATPSSTPSGTTTATATPTSTDGGSSAGLVRLDQKFQIIEAKASDGSQLDSVSFTSNNDQTSDVSVTQEQMEQIQQLRQELQAAQERAAFGDDGGGGLFDFSGGLLGGPSLAMVAALVGGGWLISQSD